MAKKYEDFKVDIRALNLNMARGNINKAEYDAFVASLPDLSGQLEEVPAYEEKSDDSTDLTFSVA